MNLSDLSNLRGYYSDFLVPKCLEITSILDELVKADLKLSRNDSKMIKGCHKLITKCVCLRINLLYGQKPWYLSLASYSSQIRRVEEMLDICSRKLNEMRSKVQKLDGSSAGTYEKFKPPFLTTLPETSQQNPTVTIESVDISLTLPKPINPEDSSHLISTTSPTISFVYIKSSDLSEEEAVAILKKKIDGIPNLIVRYKTECNFQVSLDELDKIKLSNVVASSDLQDRFGLCTKLVLDGFCLSGISRAEKGFDGHLQFIFKEQDASGSHFHSKPLYIEANPKTKWKECEPDNWEGYIKPHLASEGLDLDFLGYGWQMVAASVRGRLHAHYAKAREDHFAIVSDPASGWLLVAVADGAGSAKFSRKGSQIICDTSLAVLRQHLVDSPINKTLEGRTSELQTWKESFMSIVDASRNLPHPKQMANHIEQFQFGNIFHQAIYESYMALHNEATRKAQEHPSYKEVNIRDFKSTLLCAALKRLPAAVGGYFLVTYWIGDGGLALLNWNRQSRVLVMGNPDHGDYPGEVKFLANEDVNAAQVRERLRYSFFDDFDALILATDGVTDPFFPNENDDLSEEKWRHFWEKSIREGDIDNPSCMELFDNNKTLTEKKQALINWMNFYIDGHHDDRTMVAILRGAKFDTGKN